MAFKFLPHFRLPDDHTIKLASATALPIIKANFNGEAAFITIGSETGIFRVEYQGVEVAFPSHGPPCTTEYNTELSSLEGRFDRSQPLKLRVIGGNGKERIIADVWKLFPVIVHVPSTPPLTLRMHSVTPEGRSEMLDRGDHGHDRVWRWAVLLSKRSQQPDEPLTSASIIDIRVGGVLDGLIVKCPDGSTVPCGPH